MQLEGKRVRRKLVLERGQVEGHQGVRGVGGYGFKWQS